MPSHHYEDPDIAQSSTKITLKQALTKCYDLRWRREFVLRLPWHDALSIWITINCTLYTASHRSPKQDIFKLMSTLHASCSPPSSLAPLEESAQEAYLANRHVVDILREMLPATKAKKGILLHRYKMTNGCL